MRLKQREGRQGKATEKPTTATKDHELIRAVATTAGIWRFGLGQRKTLCHRCRPNRQSDRRLRNRTLGFRLEKVSGKTSTSRLDSFCDRDQPRSGGRGPSLGGSGWVFSPHPQTPHPHSALRHPP